MKITGLEIHILRAPDEGRPHWVSNFVVPRANEILVRMHTDEGIEGIGMATSYTPIEAAIKAFKTGIGELVIGEDPLAPERLYQRLFALTLAADREREGLVAGGDRAHFRRSRHRRLGHRRQGRRDCRLYRLFGGYRNEVPCYVTCAYYRDGKDMAELRDEIQMLKAQGHTGFKGKVGGLRARRRHRAHGAGARDHRRRQGAHDRRQPRLGSRHGDRRRAAARAAASRAGWRSRCAGPMTAGN